MAALSSGVKLAVRLTPKSSREAIEKIAPGANGTIAMRVRVNAPPAEGRANAALIELIAKNLRVAKRDVHLLSGQTSRTKVLFVSGNEAELHNRLSELGA